MSSQNEQYRLTLSTISHEIRNPVAIISSYLQLTQKRYPQVVNFDTWKPIMENMNFLKLLLHDLSLYNNACTLHKKQVCLDELIQSVINDCQLSTANIRFNFDHPQKQLSAFLDVEKIRCALLNLIRNSVEALKDIPDGSINISLFSDNDLYHILVANNGPRIPEDFIPSLFEPFVTHKKDGTGLGLPLVKKIVSAHQGTIFITSTPEQTCFHISIPKVCN